MADYHVGCGILGTEIYAGTLETRGRFAGKAWKNRSVVTDEAISAVRDYMVETCLGGCDCKKSNNSGFEWTLKDGRVVQLRVSIGVKAEENVIERKE